MDSCLVFIYNEKSNSALSYIKKEINRNKLELKSIHGINISKLGEDELNDSRTNERDELYQNIHVIKSEICGLGKTKKIKKQIEEKVKEYIHFPVGGNVTRNILFQKLKAFLDEIEKKKISNNKVAVYLDLYDNNEASILNDFYFHF